MGTTYGPHCNAPDCLLDASEILKRDANVRRWYYRLVGKRARHFRSHQDFIGEQIAREKSVFAREGLALATQQNYRPKLSAAMLEWMLSEENVLVKLALLPHFVRFSNVNKDYHQLVEELLRLEVSGPYVGPALLASISSLGLEQTWPKAFQKKPKWEQAPLVSIQIEGIVMTNKSGNVTINQARESATINVGAISQSSEQANATGAVHNEVIGINAEALKRCLEQVRSSVGDIGENIDENKKAEAVAALNDILAEVDSGKKPQQSLLRKSWSVLSGIAKSTPAAVGFSKL